MAGPSQAQALQGTDGWPQWPPRLNDGSHACGKWGHDNYPCVSKHIAEGRISNPQWIHIDDSYVPKSTNLLTIHLSSQQNKYLFPYFLHFQVFLFIPVLTFFISIVLCVLGLYYDPYKNGIGVLLVLSGIPVYLIFVVWRRKPAVFNRTMGEQLI